MSIWENNGNGNKCLAGMETGMRFKFEGIGRNVKAESHSHTPPHCRLSQFTPTIPNYTATYICRFKFQFSGNFLLITTTTTTTIFVITVFI